MSGEHLRGLEGNNPLGFLAALGVQVAFATEADQPHLWWSNDVTPHAIVDGPFSVDRIVSRTLEACAKWKDSPAINPKWAKGDELKLKREDIRAYLKHATQSTWSGALGPALVAEGSLDNQNVAKPSDLYFTAGQQKFLVMARELLCNVTGEDIAAGLESPWRYDSKLPSMGWDISDDPIYALRASDPSKQKKLTNPGPEVLALLGLSLHPVFAGESRTLTQGCSGKWKSGYYCWPLWDKPASPRVVKSLLAHTTDGRKESNRRRWYRSWGVSAILRSPIRRTGQGGYGTFGPPEVVWS